MTGTPAAIDTGTALRKFVDPLPWLGAPRACTMWDGSTKLSGYLPVAAADTTTYPGSDYYEIALVEYTQQMHSDLPKATRLSAPYRRWQGSDGLTKYPVSRLFCLL